MSRPGLGVWRGTALYIGSILGPGVLLVPSLALQAAGPASLLAWTALLVLSAPLAITFAALGVRYPVAGGVAAYARAGLGRAAGSITGGCFLTAVLIGSPAVCLIGGYYVASLLGGGTAMAVSVGIAIFATVLVLNALGLRVSSATQLVLSGVLLLVISIAIVVALPSKATQHWHPFAPHGWLAVGTAASILVWLFVGWEAVAQLVAEFGDPARELPRSMARAFAAVTVLYIGLAVATLGVSSTVSSRVPLADLVAVGFGSSGRKVTAVIAVALTMGTVNVYQGGTARLVAALAADGQLPARVVEPAPPAIPRRPLLIIGLIGAILFAVLLPGWLTATELIRATSACFVAVYVTTTASAVRLLRGAPRVCATVSFALVTVVAGFSAAYLLTPALAACLFYLVSRSPQAGRIRGEPARGQSSG